MVPLSPTAKPSLADDPHKARSVADVPDACVCHVVALVYTIVPAAPAAKTLVPFGSAQTSKRSLVVGLVWSFHAWLAWRRMRPPLPTTMTSSAVLGATASSDGS